MGKHLVVAALICSALPFQAFAAGPNDAVESAVREYFADIPVMIAIARCESEMRQFSDSGSPLMGGAGSKMVGIFQVHTGVHTSAANSMGINLDTIQGNMEYARHLYNQSGTVPWNSSYGCWKVAQAELENGSIIPARAVSEPGSLSINLRIGMEHPQVAELQKLLNRAGFTLAESGPGAPGFETMRFGALTRDAVKKFQCEKQIVCEGDEDSSGYGMVGPTRSMLVNSAEKSTTMSASNNIPVGAAPESTPASTPVTAQSESYSVEQLNEIARLQSQIAELMATLSALKGTQ